MPANPGREGEGEKRGGGGEGGGLRKEKEKGGEEKVEREMKGLKGEKLQSCMFSSYLQLCTL